MVDVVALILAQVFTRDFRVFKEEMPSSRMANLGFYTVGGMYISRQADQDLLQLCREGALAYILTPRQMGRSSLMSSRMNSSLPVCRMRS